MAFALFCAFCTGASAQQSDVPVIPLHAHTQSGMIDGFNHPELIPDISAYRLYLLAVSRSASPTDDERKSQAAMLRPVHLSDQDNQALIAVLVSFRERYMRLIQDFNKRAESAQVKGQYLDQAPLLRDRDTLVQSTHDTLKSVLTPVGWSHLDNHVQNEKRMMKIPIVEGLR